MKIIRRKAPESLSLQPGLGQPELGRRLSETRISKGWTLKQLSEASGVAIGTLSKIENGKSGASFDTMAKVSNALKLTLDSVLNPAQPSFTTGRRTISRAGEGEKFGFSAYDYTMPCNEFSRKAMIPIIMKIKEREVLPFDSWANHAGEEYIFIISGSIRFYTEYYEPVQLNAGDSVYFDSAMKHAFSCVGDAEAEMLSVCMSAPLDALLGPGRE